MGAIFQSGVGLWQFFTQSAVASTLMGWAAHPAWAGGASVIETAGERWLRAYGGLPHPNVLGGWMAVAIIVALSLVVAESRPRIRALLLGCLVLLSGGLAVSFSRSAWIAATLGVAIGALSAPAGARKRYVQSILVVLLASAAILTPYRSLLTTRLESTARLEQQSLLERQQQYREAWGLIRETGLGTGVGLGQYTLSVAKNYPGVPVWKIQPVHNVFVLMVAELGVFGGILIILLSYSFYTLLRRSKNFVHCSLFTVFVVLALADHYLWSLHGGLLLGGTISGLLFNNARDAYRPS